MPQQIAVFARPAALSRGSFARLGWEARVSARINGWGLVSAERHRVALVKNNDLVFFAPPGSDFDDPVVLDDETLQAALVAAGEWAERNDQIDAPAGAQMHTYLCRVPAAPIAEIEGHWHESRALHQRVLYLRVEVEAPAECDPMQDLSDVATWAELQLNHADITAKVTAYACTEDLVQDDAEQAAATEDGDGTGERPRG